MSVCMLQNGMICKNFLLDCVAWTKVGPINLLEISSERKCFFFSGKIYWYINSRINKKLLIFIIQSRFTDLWDKPFIFIPTPNTCNFSSEKYTQLPKTFIQKLTFTLQNSNLQIIFLCNFKILYYRYFKSQMSHK